MKVKLDVALPILLVPLGLALATVNFFFTVLVLIGLPVTILGFYQVWLYRPHKTRTKVFYSWGLTSVIQMYYTFQFIVISFREVLLWENLLLTTMFGLMMYAFYKCKKGPGVINKSQDTKDKEQFHVSDSFSKNTYSRITEAMHLEESERLHSNDDDQLESIDLKDSPKKDSQQENGFTSVEDEERRGHIVNADMVTWVDSRMVKDGRVKTWCRWCRLHKAPRSGHCTVCNVCVPGRDHHCVWIDECIGAGNHRWFLAALVLFLLTGAYGTHLTLTTVCTPEMYWDWFLFPNDCRFVYSDFPNALCFVSACYSVTALVLMSLVLVDQLITVSQNVTNHELHAARRRGWARWGLFARHNINNRGIIRNWRDFFTGVRRQNPHYGTLRL